MCNKFILLGVVAALFLSTIGVIAEKSDKAPEKAADQDARMQWWRDARFGMFIHWGLYAIPAGEWDGEKNHAEWIRHTAQIPVDEYDKFVDQFNPVKFDAEKWVKMAKDAGMKYIVVTSKHHDGFCLWDSKKTEYDIMSTPFKRDILKELTKACEKYGIRMCFYHSIMDWHHPDYLPRRGWEKEQRPADGADFDRYIKYMKGQVKELVERYDPGVLWFDGEWESTWTHQMGTNLYNYVRSLSLDIIINNRVDKGRRGMEGLTESGFAGDFGTPEQEIPDQGIPGMDWESCMTMNNHWGWNKNDDNWKSTKDLIRKLADIASKGGNFLLNIGPKADGTFPEESVARLKGIGDWMDVNAESIYGTSASPFEKPLWGRCTQKQLPNGDTRLYLHVFDWPGDNILAVPPLKNKPILAFLLDGKSELSLTKENSLITIELPETMPDENDTVVVLDIQGEPEPAPIDPYADETQSERDQRMQWWRDAGFGMFIHWGVYSVPAGIYKGEKIPGIGEWIMNRAKIPVAEYKEYANEFNPIKYNPDEWVKLAKQAGMKYIVITSKHHDGFALFDSKVTDWDIADATPYGKDLLKPLAEACRKYGIKLGFYYSEAQDWCHPGGAAAGGHWDEAQDGDMDEYINDIAAPQVREILSNYGDLAVLWWDTPTDMNKERADALLPLIRLQPGIIINNRLGGGYRGDTETPEQHIPPTGIPGRDWETCMTMNNTWGYKSYDDNWKSVETLIRNLVDITSKGGNYLLNVGPTSEGLIPEASIVRLKQIGEWMDINGESIYDTSASPFKRLSWGRCTKRLNENGATLYLHVFNRPDDGKILAPGLKNKPVKAYLLADKAQSPLKARSTDRGIVVNVPDKPVDEICTVVVLKIKGELNVEQIPLTQKDDGTIVLPAVDAVLHGSELRYEYGGNHDNIGYWTNPEEWAEWSFNVHTPGEFNIELVSAAMGETKFDLVMGDQVLTIEAPDTGDYADFTTTDAGTIEIPETGKKSIAVKPVVDEWSPLNLRAIKLIPITK